MKRIFKPRYKKNCNWCKYLSYWVSSDDAECLINNEKIEFTEDILNNKTCEYFRCCNCNRTVVDIIKDFIIILIGR